MHQKFEGNSKYLFLYIANARKADIKAVWISRNKNLVQELHHREFSAHYWLSLKGIWYSLRAGYFFVDTSIEVINYWLSGGAKEVNLFHALPIKKMERDVKKGKSSEVLLYNSNGLMKLVMMFMLPWRFLTPDYVCSTSPLYTKIFMSMFHIPKERVFEAGYPRNDVFFKEIDGSEIGVDKGVLSEVKQLKQESIVAKTIFYAPTFRDTGGSSFLEEPVLLEKLDTFLREYQAVFLVKLHPFTRINIPDKAQYKNIRFVPSSSDSYTFLKLSDILITDYSSIFVDFLLMDRPEIFFPYDYEKYITKDRELYFNYNSFTPGPKAYTFSELLDAIKSILGGNDEYADKRKEIRDRAFTYQDGNSSSRVFTIVKNLSS